MSSLRSASIFAALAAVLGMAACNRSVASVCRQRCECSPCTDFDLQQCVDAADQASELASKADCIDAFDALVGCYDDTLSCRSGQGPGTTECEKEEKLLKNCDGKLPNPFLTVCEEAQKKTGECNGSIFSPEQAPCVGTNACNSQCIIDFPCESLVNGDQAFFECISNCQLNGGSGGFGPK